MNNTNENQEISLQEAINLTTNYRANRPVNFPQYETFDIDAVKKLISNEQCKFLRIYFGMKSDNEVDLILVAADEQGQDLLPADNQNSPGVTSGNNILLEDGFRCPQFCPSGSVLAGNQP